MRLELRVSGVLVHVGFDVPVGALKAEPTAVDLSVAPGASLLAARAFVLAGGERLELACVTASSGRWAPGLEVAVLDGATAVVRKTAAFDAGSAGAATWTGSMWAQDFRLSAGERQAWGRHVLGFAGADSDVILCTSLCSGFTGRSDCGAAVASLSFDGALQQPPEGSALTRSLLWCATHPGPALGAGVVMACAVVALVLWRRPRPRA